MSTSPAGHRNPWRPEMAIPDVACTRPRRAGLRTLETICSQYMSASSDKRQRMEPSSASQTIVGIASTEDYSTLEVTSEDYTSVSTTTDGAVQSEIPVATTTGAYVENKNIEMTTVHVGNETHSENLMSILICVGPIIILLLLIPLIYFIVKRMRWKKEDKDKAKDENIKSPIFEEDTPSVMEIEMEELDKWMNDMKKNGSRLSVLEEEGKLQITLSDDDHEDVDFENGH